MKVGDMVVRAYAFRAFIPGVIVDEEVELLEPDGDDGDFEPYEDHHYIVQWSDGTQSREMYEELDYLSDALDYAIEVDPGN